VVHLEAIGLNKRYEGVHALQDVSVEIVRGHVHGFVGENGAGKTTFGKVVSGATQRDDGVLKVHGREVNFRSPREALAGGIALVHQEVALAPGLSVLQNVFLGVEDNVASVVRTGEQRAKFNVLMKETGFDLDPDARARTLRLSEQQKVEITRALARNAELIVLDEPTRALTSDETSRLLDLVRLLRERGTTIIYVSHDLDEVLEIVDTVTVLKDGRHISTRPAGEETVETLVTKMLGRSLETMFPDKRAGEGARELALRVRGLRRSQVIRDVSFEVRAGEIVGMAGLVGSGRSEVARAIFGADRLDAGTIEVAGRPVRLRSPRDAVSNGIAMLPEDRKEQGLVMVGSVRANLTLTCMSRIARGGVLRRRNERRLAEDIARQVDIRMRGLDQPVSSLSGGNQQKVVLAKWLLRNPTVLIADEPTRGVDVGARSKIYDLIRDLANDGLGVLLISSDLEEVMGLADRILVMYRGCLVADLPGDAAEDLILNKAFGQDIDRSVAS
jgi:simple sugar transport system ATP-binding protein/ribose transport system ATP-binding protein